MTVAADKRQLKLSKHGRRRLRRRGNTTGGRDKEFLQRVVKYGLTSEYLDEGPLRDFVLEREQACPFRVVLLYAQHVYVFDRALTTLVTVMCLPKECIRFGDRLTSVNRWRVDALGLIAAEDKRLSAKPLLTDLELGRLNELYALAGELVPSTEFFREWTKFKDHSVAYWATVDSLHELFNQ